MDEELEKLLKSISGAGAKSKASLLSGMNLAGQQYFQAPYTIPSTFGNYYVGAPTPVVSDFVPLPLDFMEEKITGLQSARDAAAQLIEATPALKGFTRAPFDEETAAEYIKQYGLDTLPEEWSKQIIANPMAAKKISEAYTGLTAKMAADPRTQRFKDRYTGWQKAETTGDYKTGYSNVWDPKTQSFIQLGMESDPIYVKDEAEEYVKDYYDKTLKASIIAEFAKEGMNVQTDPNGIMYYINPVTKTKEYIDPLNNRFTKNAITATATKLRQDPNAQVEFILKQKRGLSSEQDFYDYISQTLSPQFYEKITVEGGTPVVVKEPTGKGEGDKKTNEPYSEVTTIPITKVNREGPQTFEELNNIVLNNTNFTTTSPDTTKTPYMTVEEATSTFKLPPTYFTNTADGELVKTPDGNTFSANYPLEEDIIGRNTEWGPLNITGNANISFTKQGEDLLPTINDLNLVDGNGNPLDKNSDAYKGIYTRLVTKQTKDIADKKTLNFVKDETAKEELTLFKKRDGSTINKLSNQYLNSRYIKQEVEDPYEDDIITQYVDKNTGEKKTPQQIQKETSEWLKNLSDKELLEMFRANPNTSIANKVTEKVSKSPHASTKIITFHQKTAGEGGQFSQETLHPLSRAEANLVALWGHYDSDGKYTGNAPFLYGALEKAQLIEEDGSLNSLKGTTDINGEAAYKKYEPYIQYGGFGFAPDGKSYYYGVLRFNNPDPKYFGDVTDLEGKRIAIPTDAAPQTAKQFMEGLSLQNSEKVYAEIVGNAIGQGKSGVLLNLSKEVPWVKESSSITWQRPTYVSEGQGGIVKVTVNFKTPQITPDSPNTPKKSYTFEANDSFDAGLQLHDLNAYYLYKDAFNNYQGGTGGSSTGGGKPQLGAKK